MDLSNCQRLKFNVFDASHVHTPDIGGGSWVVEGLDAATGAKIVVSDIRVEFVYGHLIFAGQDLEVANSNSIHDASLATTNRAVADVTVCQVDGCFELHRPTVT